ncbi:MAG TPA: carbohydrate ABC transporter permease [Candidatus Eisenbergiella intestinipullorum]|nr:carbohydrate ABC transporter permease [Candidatus Eisenbergiella intestinipullorum]
MNSKVKKSKGDRIFIFIVYVLMGLLALICLYPMWHVVMASFSDPIRLMGHSGVILKPLGHSLEGYKVVLQNPNIPISYRNTIFYVLAGTAINMLMTTLGAYALSRKGFMFKRTLTLLIVFTMYFNAGLVPNFLLVKGLGMYDSVWALLLPGAISTWNLIVMKTSFQSVPVSLEESARLDGANDFVILGRIFLPLSKATVAVMILFYAVAHWSSWFNAMIYLNDRSKYPLQLIMREILISNSTSGNIMADTDAMFLQEVVKYATIVVSTVPILFIYPFAQKYFMAGVMMGSVKE